MSYRADESQEILYVNYPTCRIFGCENLEEFRKLTGFTFRGMVHPEDFEKIQSSIDDQIADKTNHQMDYVVYRIIRKDGSVRWVDDYGHFTNLPGFGDVYYVFIGDITDTRIVQEEKERSKMLEKSLELAEQANVAKSAFLSNMSHEIRTPITAILGMNEMIYRESEDPNIREYSENIRKAGESLLGIINDILDFSKIEAGKMELVPARYSLSSAIGDLYNLVQFRAEAKALDLKFEIDPQIPEAMSGDELRIKQIITNLLTNAIKYTEKGGVKLSLSLVERQGEEVAIRVSVKDTGIGIRKEDLGALFQPFDRVDTQKNRGIEGTGLGLAISRQMLSLMGSDLLVESTYGEGSEFFFTLRQQAAGEETIGSVDFREMSSEESTRTKSRVPFKAEGARLLVVDDTPMNLQVISGLLKFSGVQIDTAADGRECIEKFGSNDYDLVFLDYRMPGLDGIETLRELKRQFPEKASRIPIISLTASAISGDRERMLDAGFTDYLAKPVNISQMEAMMMLYLPEEIVELAESEEELDPEAEIEEELSLLPESAFQIPLVDPRTGIEYCGDAEEYIFAVEIYEQSIEEKASVIETALAEEDVETFTLNVHSLKSTSMAIGANPIFAQAKALEEAGKSMNLELMHRDTPLLLQDYRGLKQSLVAVVEDYNRENGLV
ncbi:MAG: response regulator [Lachnospiraceae bacterium]|nr:response regulator [Lachnospiraceae bacterium]